MSQPSEVPMSWPCRRCEHPRSAHAVGAEVERCEVELSPSAVPSLTLGSVCPCPGFVSYEEPEPDEAPASEVLDGPAMYAEALGCIRLARAASSPLVEEATMRRAQSYFAGASAAALAAIVIENGTGDIDEQRWRAALAGEAELPESGQA